MSGDAAGTSARATSLDSVLPQTRLLTLGALMGAPTPSIAQYHAVGDLVRQGEQVRRQIFQVLQRQFVGWHDRARRHLLWIGKVVFHPTAALALGNPVQ